MPLRAVLLDMGGVLLDPGNPEGLPMGRHDFRGREALLALLRERGEVKASARVVARASVRPGGRPGVKLDPDALEQLLFGPWRTEHARRYELGREADWHPHLVRLRRATRRRFSDRRLLTTWFAPYAETVRPIAGAAETLAELSARFPLGLVSNVPLPGALYEPLLARHGLLAPFTVRRWSYESGSRKPSPAMIVSALAALGVAPQEAVMVGDRRGADVAAGRSAGVRTVWLRSSDSGGPAPDRTIERISELPRLLGSWPG